MQKKNYYSESGYRNYQYSGLIGYLMRKSHLLMEKFNFYREKKFLEIGPSFEPHIKFVNLKYEEYHCIDLDNSYKIKKYYKEKFNNVKYKCYDGKKIPYPDNYFDRIIISHCLEHIINPENFINEMLRVIKKKRFISIALPCDPGLLWRFGRFFSKMFFINKKNVNSRGKNFDHDYLIATEHVNSIFNLITILKKKFKISNEIYYPFNIGSADVNLFYICTIQK